MKNYLVLLFLSTLVVCSAYSQSTDIDLWDGGSMSYSATANDGTISWGNLYYDIGPFGLPSGFHIGWYASLDWNITSSDFLIDEVMIPFGIDVAAGTHYQPGAGSQYQSVGVNNYPQLPHNTLLRCGVIIDSHNVIFETDETNNTDNLGSFSIILLNVEGQLAGSDQFGFDVFVNEGDLVVNANVNIEAQHIELFNIDGKKILTASIPSLDRGATHTINVPPQTPVVIWRSTIDDNTRTGKVQIR